MSRGLRTRNCELQTPLTRMFAYVIRGKFASGFFTETPLALDGGAHP